MLFVAKMKIISHQIKTSAHIQVSPTRTPSGWFLLKVNAEKVGSVFSRQTSPVHSLTLLVRSLVRLSLEVEKGDLCLAKLKPTRTLEPFCISWKVVKLLSWSLEQVVKLIDIRSIINSFQCVSNHKLCKTCPTLLYLHLSLHMRRKKPPPSRLCSVGSTLNRGIQDSDHKKPVEQDLFPNG